MSGKISETLSGLVSYLKEIEIKISPEKYPSGNTRYPHWFRLELYSDGSGRIQDSNTKETIYLFDNVRKLEEKINDDRLQKQRSEKELRR